MPADDVYHHFEDQSDDDDFFFPTLLGDWEADFNSIIDIL